MHLDPDVSARMYDVMVYLYLNNLSRLISGLMTFHAKLQTAVYGGSVTKDTAMMVLDKSQFYWESRMFTEVTVLMDLISTSMSPLRTAKLMDKLNSYRVRF